MILRQFASGSDAATGHLTRPTRHPPEVIGEVGLRKVDANCLERAVFPGE